MSKSTNRRQRGMTFIELIMFIVIVGVGLAGILTALNTSARANADPLFPKQALAIAESLLEEILLKNFCDPDGAGSDMTTTPPTCGANGVEARNAFDAVQDFDAVGGGATAVATDATGANWPAGYAVTVAVTNGAPIVGITPLQIQVNVTDPQGDVITLTGFRANY
jgi:MSHA pilin protein MshD